MIHEMTWETVLQLPVPGHRHQSHRLAPSTEQPGEVDGRTQPEVALERAFAELAEVSGEHQRQRLLTTVYDLLGADLYGVALWRTGSPADAADIVQIIFLRLAAGKVAFQRVRNPKLFLFSMAHRAAIDVLRARRPTIDLDALGQDSPPILVEPTSPAARVVALDVSKMLHTLPKAKREALYLRYFVGLTFAEIGRVTGVPTFTAASRCRSGIATLRRDVRAGTALEDSR